MSIQAVDWAINIDAGLSTSERMVMIGVAYHDGDGGAWPSIDTLARYACCNPSTVRRALKALVDKGLLVVHKNQGGGPHTPVDRRPNLYVLARPHPVDDAPLRGRTVPPRGGIDAPTGSHSATRTFQNPPTNNSDESVTCGCDGTGWIHKPGNDKNPRGYVTRCLAVEHTKAPE